MTNEELQNENTELRTRYQTLAAQMEAARRQCETEHHHAAHDLKALELKQEIESSVVSERRAYELQYAALELRLEKALEFLFKLEFAQGVVCDDVCCFCMGDSGQHETPCPLNTFIKPYRKDTP